MRIGKAFSAPLLACVALIGAALPVLAATSLTWSVVDSPNTSSAESNHLFGVACPTATDCWAVGEYFDTSTSSDQTLIEQYDGSSWAIVSSPNPSAGITVLYAIDCVNATDCWAVGVTYNSQKIAQTLIEQYGGTSWSVVSSPNVSADGDALESVTCPSASNCWAVGFSTTASGNFTLAEQYDGTTWVPAVTSNVTASENNYLQSVACASTSDCWAVGGYHDSNGNSLTLVESFNGTVWVMGTSASPSATQNNLTGVTCVTASDCWAVGEESNGATMVGLGTTYDYESLVEHYTGSAWTVVSSPNVITSMGTVVNSTFLNTVTCTSADDCWAVGEYGVEDLSVIEQYDGTSWNLVSSPNAVGSTSDVLEGVTCISASDCWAVGWSTPAEMSDQTLIVHGVGSLPPSVPEARAPAALLLFSATACILVHFRRGVRADADHSRL